MPVQIEIYEFWKASACCASDSCCGPKTSTESEILEALLQQEFGDNVDIKRIDLTTEDKLPPVVEETIQEYGVTIEPLTVVNGTLVAKGALPNLLEFMRIVRESMEED